MRVLSIPFLFLLPFLCAGIGNAFIPMRGDNIPVGFLLGFLGGITAVVVVSRYTVFARSERLVKARRILLALVVFDLLAIPMARTINWVLNPKVHDRASLRFTQTTPATVDVTGLWKATLTDEKQKLTETFFMNLTQSQASISGNIHEEFLGKMDSWPEAVEEGKVSGDSINLLWNSPGPARIATLLGVVTNDAIKGTYFRHVYPPHRDQSQTGFWQATRIGPYRTNTFAD
jgi:hypothetical protein